MDAIDDTCNWGDPYIGLRWAAETVEGFIQVSMGTAAGAQGGMNTTLHNPTIWENIASACRDFIYWIKPWNFLPWVYSVTVYPAVKWLRDNVINPLKDAIAAKIESVKNAVGGLGWDIYWRFVGWYAWGQGKIGDLTRWGREKALPAIAAVGHTISGLPYTIYSHFVGWYEWGKGQVERLVRWSREKALPAIAALGHKISGLPHTIYSYFVGWYEWGKGQIAALSSWWKDHVWPQVQMFFAGLVQGSVEATMAIDGSTAQAKEAIATVVPAKIDETLSAIEGQVLAWFADFKNLPREYLTFVAETAGTDLALEPSRALATAGSLYSMSIAAGSAAHVVATALNAIPTLNWVGASQLAAFVAEVAGFDQITKATYGTLLDGALAWPMRYHWNQMLRPRIPTEGAVFLMGRKRGLNRAEFGRAMAYHGLPEWWIDKEYQFFWTDPSPYWLLRMSEHATPELKPSSAFLPWLNEWLPNWRADPWAWFKMKLMLAGFEDTDIPAFIDGFQRRRLGPAVTQVKTSVRAMVREGYWGRIEAKAALEPMGVREEEIEYLILAEEIDYQNRFLDGQVLYLNESFRKGEISRQDLSLSLSTIIVKPERVAQIVSREVVRALPKPKSVVPVKEDPRVKSLVTQAVGSWTKGYRAWELEEEELEVGLTIVLQDPALAKQMVVVERTRYRPPPPPPPPIEVHPLVVSALRAAVGSWIARYRAWEIDADVLYNALASILEDEPLAREIVETERARYREPLPPAPPIEVHPLVVSALRAAVASWIARYRAWEIDAGELEAALVQVLEDEPLAREIVATEQERYRPPPPPPPVLVEDPLVRKSRTAAIASWVAQFRAGTVTAAVMELGLAQLIVDPDIVVLIRQIEELRAVPAPDIIPPWEEDPLVAAVRQQAVSGHIEMFRKRLIAIDELYVYLVADGLAEPLARVTALTQALKRIKTPPLESPYFAQDPLRELIDEAIDSYTRMRELGQITMEEFRAYLAATGVDPDVITYLGDTQEVRRFILLEGMA